MGVSVDEEWNEKAVHIIVSRPPVDLLAAAIELGCHSSCMARRGTTVMLFLFQARRFRKNVE